VRHLKLAGMLLILALAACGLAAATASAAEPEFLDNVTGNTFSGTSGAGKLEDPVTKLTIACSKDNVLLEGNEITGAKTIKLDIHFEGCTLAGLAFNSLGDAKAIMLVKATGELCTVSKAPTLTVGMLLKITPVHVEVPSILELVELTGTMLGTITPLKELKTGPYTLVLNSTTAKEKCEGGVAPELKLEKEHNKTPLAIIQTTTETITFDKDVLIDG
jgi:hypothetical protein